MFLELLSNLKSDHATETVAAEEIRSGGLHRTDFAQVVSGNVFHGGVTGRPSILALVSKAVYGLIRTQISKQEGIAVFTVDPKERRVGAVGLKRDQRGPGVRGGILDYEFCQLLDRRCLEDGSNREIFTEGFLYLTHQAQGQQGITPSIKKVVMDADGSHGKNFLPKTRQLAFNMIARRNKPLFRFRTTEVGGRKRASIDLAARGQRECI